MNKQTLNTNRLYGLIHTDVEGIDSLIELALDVRWSWNHAADKIWQQLDPALWELTHNPWMVLQTVSKDQLERQFADPDFKNKINELMKLNRQVASAPT